MKRLLALAALLATTPALAQTGDPALAPTAGALRADLETVMRVASTAALAHAETGAFPASAFDLLGRSWSAGTGVRSTPLSSMTVAPSGGEVEVGYVPLPTDPYVREDEVVTFTLRPEADGLYRGTYTIVRRADPDDGGATLPYSVAGRYRVERAVGTFCIEAERVRSLVAEGRFTPDPALLSREPLTLRVHPPGEPEPVYYEVTEAGR